MKPPVIIKSKDSPSCKVPKDWGYEIIFANNEQYCGKLLVFKKGCQFSMHYHLIKDETWYVQSGEFLFSWIDTKKAEVQEAKLVEGDSVRINMGQPHQLKSLTGGTIFEVSTQHFNEDSYRIWR
tara:strand:+ start:6818 stop:7189 length:372 start_codon:yes stop_codon:yes gene_type:complete